MEGPSSNEGTESSATGRRSGARTVLAGVEVRDEDLEPQSGLHFIGMVFRVCAVVILLLALWQFADWWLDRPPGNVGMAVLVGDTIRLVVIAALLWAAANLADLLVKSHYDVRASRILLARQTYMMQQMAIASGAIAGVPAETNRRGLTPAESMPAVRRPTPGR